MEKLSVKEKAAFGIGAVGKDMVYALSASYVMYFYQDVMGISATFMGVFLLFARVFDAVIDPPIGVAVARTRTRWGRFRPWIFTGTLLSAVTTFALFAAPDLEGAALMAYFVAAYLLWCLTYSMMDIPYWSMIPAVTRSVEDREQLSLVGRTCAGVGSALISMFCMLLVGLLGGDSERAGFRWVALIVAVCFVAAELLCCANVRDVVTGTRKSREHRAAKGTDAGAGAVPADAAEPALGPDAGDASFKEMLGVLLHNDQALVVTLGIVLINTALYITSNLVIYFFKYDFGGADWKTSYTLFSTVGGAAQIFGMMILYPLLRRRLTSLQVFNTSLALALTGYAVLLGLCLAGQSHTLALLFVPGFLVFACNGMLSVLTTLFLSNTVDYGELVCGRREESVIFSMQTFVVQVASGVSVLITGVGLDLIGLVGNSDELGEVVRQSASTILGLRLLMTVLPVIVLACVLALFRKKFLLNDDKATQIAAELAARRTERS